MLVRARWVRFSRSCFQTCLVVTFGTLPQHAPSLAKGEGEKRREIREPLNRDSNTHQAPCTPVNEDCIIKYFNIQYISQIYYSVYKYLKG